jgi:protein CpxP
MKTKLLIGVGALALVLAAGAAWAMGPGGHRGHMMKHMISAHIEDMEDYLEATPAQRQVIEQAKNEIVGAIEARAKTNHEAHGQLMAALTGDKVDEAKLYAFADARAQDIKDLAKVIVPQLVKVHDTLTPAQRQKLADKIKSGHERWPGGFGGQ